MFISEKRVCFWREVHLYLSTLALEIFSLTYPERVIVADFGAEFISRYLKANNLRDISDCREYPSYLKNKLC